MERRFVRRSAGRRFSPSCVPFRTGGHGRVHLAHLGRTRLSGTRFTGPTNSFTSALSRRAGPMNWRTSSCCRGTPCIPRGCASTINSIGKARSPKIWRTGRLLKPRPTNQHCHPKRSSECRRVPVGACLLRGRHLQIQDPDPDIAIHFVVRRQRQAAGLLVIIPRPVRRFPGLGHVIP